MLCLSVSPCLSRSLSYHQMRLPSKPYSSLPIYSIGSTNTLPRDRLEAMAGVAKSMSVADGAGPSGAPPPASTSASAKGSPSARMKGSPSRPGRGRAGASPEKASQGQSRHSLQKTMSK